MKAAAGRAEMWCWRHTLTGIRVSSPRCVAPVAGLGNGRGDSQAYLGHDQGLRGGSLVGASVIRSEPVWHRVRLSVLRRTIVGSAVAAGLMLAVTSGAWAQAGEPVQSANLPSVTAVEMQPAPGQQVPGEMAPVPDEAPKRPGPLHVHVFGDSLGDGIWAGLYRKLPKADGYRVTKHSRVSTGLVRKDFYNWSKAVRQIVAKHRVDVAVVMIGTNDRQTIVEGGRHALRSARWEEIYKSRIDDMIQVLKDEGAEVYWVELPAMRSPRFGRDMRYFNTLFEERAAANGITYVPTWERTLGGNGQYSAYGTDDTGRKRLMRTNDGIHFTMRGYIQLASFVTSAMEQPRTPEPVLPMVEVPADPPAIDPVTAVPQSPVEPTVDVPVPAARPGDDRAALEESAPQRSERAGVSEVASSIAGALSDLRGFVLPEPKPGRADDLRQPAQ